jgi:hypothetical protein
MAIKTAQKPCRPACLAIVCWFWALASCAGHQSANSETASSAVPSSSHVQAFDKKPDSGQQPSEAHRQAIAGDDIGIGLEASIRLLDPSYDNCGDTRGGVAKRDEKMRQLKAFLGSRPASAAPIECLVGDAAFESHGCEKHQSAMRIYYAKNVSANDTSVMASMGFVLVGERDWQTLRPWMLKAATRAAPWMPKISDLWEAVVFSYYDGNRWRIAPWFYLSCVPEMRDATEADIAIFSLIEYVNCRLQPPIEFASHYRSSLLFVPEFRAGIEQNLKQGRRWDDFGQKQEPKVAPEKKPEAKIPKVESKQE